MLDNDSKTHRLHDYLVGSDGRMVCVLTSIAESCTAPAAQLIVRDMDRIEDVSAEWIEDRKVQLIVSSGRIEKFEPHSADGQVALALSRRPSR